ncbi:hypothetical protein CC2G_002000 [Coprinopsis cinerea AmutBmut pab1-1]|nr:hypothetical protein CC2G_002000 [Coprinopsis cinerea AmutBmut pab1-1]
MEVDTISPAAPKVAKRKRRSPKEIAAEKEKKMSKKRLADIQEQARAELEAMEMAEDAARAKAEAGAIRRLSDVIENPQAQPRLQSQRQSQPLARDEEGEYVDIAEVSNTSDDETDNSANNSGDELDDDGRRFQELKAEMKLLKAKRKGGAKPRDDNKLGDATGLKASFVAKAQTQKSRLNVENRGLSDEDSTDEDQPTVQAPRRVNASTTLAAQSKTTADPEIIEVKVTKPQTTIVKPGPNGETSTRANARMVPVPFQRSYAAQDIMALAPPASRSRSRSTTPKPPSYPGPPVKETKGSQYLKATNVRETDLPMFVRANQKWKHRFLPTLFHRLYISKEPFAGFILASESFVQTVQNVVDVVYPEVEYTVTFHGEPIHLLAYNRCNEKRSLIAGEAVTKVVQKLKSFSNIHEAQSWLTWASSITGPLYFKHPIPPSSPTHPSHPAYQAPSGRFESSFVIELAQSALKHSSNAFVNTDDRPIGLFALILASLERAVEILNADGSRKPEKEGKKGEFSQAAWGKVVQDYATNFEKSVSQAKWDAIMALCSPREAQNRVNLDSAPAPILDKDRHAIFNFESPTKR